MGKKRTYREFKQGVFTPKNKDKCTNKGRIIYRSGLELSLMLVLDKNPNVISWSSEQTVIPYYKSIEKRNARYFVDFCFRIRISETEVKEFIVELKPSKQCVKPTTHGNKKPSTILYEQMTYRTNQDKWAAAEKWCEEKRRKGRDVSFIIITEKNINTILGK